MSAFASEGLRILIGSSTILLCPSILKTVVSKFYTETKSKFFIALLLRARLMATQSTTLKYFQGRMATFTHTQA